MLRLTRLMLKTIIYNCIGGSAVISCLAALISKKNNLALYTSTGPDFIPELLRLCGIDTRYIQASCLPTNKFYIDESKKEITLLTHRYLDVEISRNDIKTRHMHTSFRRGVDAINFYSKVNFKSASADIMLSSIDENIDDLNQVLGKVRFLFCNRDEYNLLTKKYNFSIKQYPSLSVIVTQKEGATVYIREKSLFFKNLSISDNEVKSTIGAGDVFTGAFLDYVLTFSDIFRSVCYGLAVATLSITKYGINHILLRKDEVYEYYQEILRRNETWIQVPSATSELENN
jgi:sugar/nucleoside kinase (ribokinase family)